MSALAVSVDVLVATNSMDLSLSSLEIIYKYFSNAAKPDDKFRKINKANDIYQALGWVDNGDSWSLPSAVTAESATAGAALIQAKIDFLKAEQEKKIVAEREKLQARLREDQEKKAELRGQYAGDKCARKEEGWKAQVSAAAMKDGKDIARVEQSSCGKGCC